MVRDYSKCAKVNPWENVIEAETQGCRGSMLNT